MNPYLIFNGNAADAIDFYKKVLDAKVEYVTHYGESPIPTDDSWKQKVLHSTVIIHNNPLMIADSSPDVTVSTGDNIQLVINNFESEKDVEIKFKALAEGGKVKMPLQKTFWASQFGMLVDRFGVHWMFNYR